MKRNETKNQTTKAVKFEWFIAHARSMKRKSYNQFTIQNRILHQNRVKGAKRSKAKHGNKVTEGERKH